VSVSNPLVTVLNLCSNASTAWVNSCRNGSLPCVAIKSHGSIRARHRMPGPPIVPGNTGKFQRRGVSGAQQNAAYPFAFCFLRRPSRPLLRLTPWRARRPTSVLG
jgi:hypothetical protein